MGSAEMEPQFQGAENSYSQNCDTDSSGLLSNGECSPNFLNNIIYLGFLLADHFVDSYCGNSSGYCSGSNCYSGS